MVRVVYCHAGVLGSNLGGPKMFSLGFTSAPYGVSTQLQSSGLVAHENSTFRNLALAVSGPFIA